MALRRPSLALRRRSRAPQIAEKHLIGPFEAGGYAGPVDQVERNDFEVVAHLIGWAENAGVGSKTKLRGDGAGDGGQDEAQYGAVKQGRPPPKHRSCRP